MIQTPETHPLTALRDKPSAFLQQLNAPYAAVTLTVDHEPAAILLHPDEYERLLDLAAYASAEEGIRQGLADIAAGRGRPAREFFAEMREKYNIRG